MNVIRLTHTPTKKQCLYHSEVALRPFSVSHRTCSASSPLSHYPHSLHHWLDLPFLEKWNHMDVLDILVPSLHVDICFHFSGLLPRREGLLGGMVNLYQFKKLPKCLPKLAVPFYIPSSNK